MPVKKHKCKQCKLYQEETIRTLAGRFCDIRCLMDFANDKKEQKKNKQHKERKKKFELNDIPHQHKLTQKAFNKMRVLEELMWFKINGIEPYCISCGKTKMDWCCGHLKTVGSSGALRYDRSNTFLQCNRYCNMGKSGNIEGCKNTHGYKKGLLLRFGNKRGQEILDYCEQHQGDVKRWTGQELKDMRAEFADIGRRIESEL